MGNAGSTLVSQVPLSDADISQPAGRPLGLVALSLAFALILGAPALFSGGVTGHSSPAPFPLPPAVGSCLTLPADPDFSGAGEQDFEVVACDQPHDAEVTMSWPAGTPPQSQVSGSGTIPFGIVPFSAEFSGPFDGNMGTSDFICPEWNLSYIGALAPLAGGSWWPASPTFDSGLISAPAGDRAGKLGWSACVVQPSTVPTRYLGTIRNTGTLPDQPRPDQYRSCLSRSEYGRSELIYSSCAQPHRVEPIAFGTEPAAAGQGLAGCLDVVRQLTGATDPSYGGRLAVKVQNVRLRTLTLEEMSALPAGATEVGDCIVELVGPGSLTGSVVGLGDRQLPVA